MGKRKGSSGPAPLTARQRGLVEKHLSLVQRHLRWRASMGQTWRRGDGDDLFQEGCVGLIEAARKYERTSPIAFRSYALGRIHLAVGTALRNCGALIKVPSKAKGADGHKREDGRALSRLPRVHALNREPVDGRTGQDLEVAGGDDFAETVGDRLRGKYEDAVELARGKELRRKFLRADRDQLVRLLVEHRLLVAEPSARLSIRRIAGASRSSVSCAFRCERRMLETIGDVLREDPEFQYLAQLTRSASEGPDRKIDADLEAQLRRLAADRFWRRLAAKENRAASSVLPHLIRETGDLLAAVVKRWFAELPPSRAETMLRMVSGAA